MFFSFLLSRCCSLHFFSFLIFVFFQCFVSVLRAYRFFVFQFSFHFSSFLFISFPFSFFLFFFVFICSLSFHCFFFPFFFCRHLLDAHVHELISHCNHTLIVQQCVLFLALFNVMAKTSSSAALAFRSRPRTSHHKPACQCGHDAHPATSSDAQELASPQSERLYDSLHGLTAGVSTGTSTGFTTGTGT